MINDIFFCLIGKTGSAFVEINNNDEINFVVNDSISCISNSEKQILNKIGEIGSKYKTIKDFINNYNELYLIKVTKNNSHQNEEMQSYSIYLKPICDCINSFLIEYERDIIALEKIFYKNLNIHCGEILSTLTHYLDKFNKVIDFLQLIYGNNMQSGELLNLVFNNTINGDPEICRIFKEIFIAINKILIKLITDFIVNGQICSEFFIKCANNYKHNSNEDLILGNYNELTSWNSNYYIEFNDVPIYFPQNLAEDILFTGKALKVLNSYKSAESDKIPNEEMIIIYNSLNNLNKVIFRDNNKIAEESNIISFINIEFLSKIVVIIKNIASKYLYKLIVVKYDILNQFNAVKNIFLTFNGEFFFNFISKIKPLLNLPFDKKIEKEINEVYFKNSLFEVFDLDVDNEKAKIYNQFRIKLISNGFNLEPYLVESYLDKKEIFYLGALSLLKEEDVKFRFINSIYKAHSGALWNNNVFDVEEDFTISGNFMIKNFTKNNTNNLINVSAHTFIDNNINNNIKTPVKSKEGLLNNDFLNRSSIIKPKDLSQEGKLTFSYIMHLSKNFDFKSNRPLNLKDLNHYLSFEFTIIYKSNNEDGFTSKFLIFSLKYVNRIKKSKIDNAEEEIEICNKVFTENIEYNNTEANFTVSFKNNYLNINGRTFNFSFPFNLNDYISKDKRKMNLGLIINTQNLDIIVDIINWNFNFLSGEIYSECANLILINYNPLYPYNFIFNANIIKRYNQIFNLIFPLKINLTLMNELWIEKKQFLKILKERNLNVQSSMLEKIMLNLDFIHSEFIYFLQNLISFFMLDVIQVNFKKFEEKFKKCSDFEQIILIHDEFLGEVISNSFVQSKKIMKVIFEILFVGRKFYNFCDNFFVNFSSFVNYSQIEEDPYSYSSIVENLISLKNEFFVKREILIDIFSKIKNSKYYTIISQLLTKLNCNQIRGMNDNVFN